MASTYDKNEQPNSFHDQSSGKAKASGDVPSIDAEAQLIASDNVKPGPSLVDWDGPDDPAKPINWPPWKKGINFGIIIYFTFLSPLASTMTSSSADVILADFGSSSEELEAFVTSAFILGYAVGPLAIAPLSELYGRVPLYLSCGLLFFAFNIACAVANSLGSLVVYRLLAGAAASCPLTIAAGSIADLISKERRGTAMAMWMLGPIFGPTLGPLICAFLTEAKGWRWNFWLMTILSGASLVAGLGLNETNPTVLLQRKTKRLEKETGNTHLRSALDQNKTPRSLFLSAIVRPLKMLFLSPIVFLLSLYMAIVYGYFYLCFTTFSLVFEGDYGFSLGISGLVYIGMGLGCAIGTIWYGLFSDWLVQRLAKRNGGVTKPEHRLPSLVIASLLVPTGLFWYGWSAQAKTHWIVPIIGTGVLGAGIQIMMTSISTYLVDAFTVYAASAMAASALLRSLFGSLLPLAGNALFGTLGVGWGSSLLAFITVVMIPVPVVFLRYGELIRLKYAVKL
ncbi:multidrug resistance protein [Xylariales sp. PMI_506]|nr:multidrug resistance protein [Xylariales sp. PMI_506]